MNKIHLYTLSTETSTDLSDLVRPPLSPSADGITPLSPWCRVGAIDRVSFANQPGRWGGEVDVGLLRGKQTLEDQVGH